MFHRSISGSGSGRVCSRRAESKNAAILYDVSDDYSQGLSEFFEETFVKKGGKIVAKEAFKTGDVDFRPQLSKIKSANPDVIFMPFVYKEVALSSNQARELGITATLMGGDTWPSEQLITMAKDAVEGSYIVNQVNYDDPDVQDLKNEYKEKYNKNMEINGYLVHDAIMMLVDAMERAGEADSEKIAKALETTDIVGITGKIKVGKDTHNPEGKEAAIVKLVNGEYVFQKNIPLRNKNLNLLGEKIILKERRFMTQFCNNLLTDYPSEVYMH